MNTLKSNNQLTVEDVIRKSALNNDLAKNNLDKIKEIAKNVDREKLVYETNEYTYSFKNFQTIRTFGKDIYDGTIKLEEADEYQTNLLVEIMNFKKNTKPRSPEKKQEKEIALKNLKNNFSEGREKIIDAFESKIFLTKSKGSGFLNFDRSKVKMLQRLPIALAQVKAGNNSESLLNEIRQIVYSLLFINQNKSLKKYTII